ncbi:glycosyltransferase [Candidatus Roseilinea sp. NK_OTU-006]|uniref:glycosyltransferase n=1 Tax=Candidatus Roseilinea sp. NK_OTU-006 TaxID=2704250 RepID=UPI00145DB3E4|nr:glycosyltransferase [Candidatus Roseilinea sp. NK_OTU-006]
MARRRVLFLTSPVGPLGSGEGGGVETNLMNLTPILARRGHTVAIAAPAGSVQPAPEVFVYQVEGKPPPYATTARRDAPVICQPDGVLERMWELAMRVQDQYDVIIGINYDWLAYYLTPFFKTPVGHIISIVSTIDAVDAIIRERFYEYPNHFAVNTCAQASTFPFIDPCRMMSLYGGVDLARYSLNLAPQDRICWVARISPEKGLEDAFAVAQRLRIPLDVCGKMQHPEYWEACVARYPDVDVTYHGFLNQDALHRVVRNAKALLMTPHWIEAFGNTCIEAMAGGTPVIAYNAGGPSELVQDGVSGFLVPPRDVDALVEAVRRVDRLDRRLVRKRAEKFSLERFADRYERFIEHVICGDPQALLEWELQASHPLD